MSYSFIFSQAVAKGIGWLLSMSFQVSLEIWVTSCFKLVCASWSGGTNDSPKLYQLVGLAFDDFVIVLKETTLLGVSEQMEDQGTTELGYDFRSDFWKQGYATKAAIAV